MHYVLGEGQNGEAGVIKSCNLLTKLSALFSISLPEKLKMKKTP